MVKTCFALISNPDNKYLLIREGGKKNYGLWNLPGGHVDAGETLEQTAVREAKEEGNVKIKLEEKLLTRTINGLEYLSDTDENDAKIEINVYKASHIDGKAKPGPEELDAKWVTADEIKNLPLRLKFIVDLL